MLRLAFFSAVAAAFAVTVLTKTAQFNAVTEDVKVRKSLCQQIDRARFERKDIPAHFTACVVLVDIADQLIAVGITAGETCFGCQTSGDKCLQNTVHGGVPAGFARPGYLAQNFRG